MMERAERLQSLNEAVADGDATQARACLLALWKDFAGPATAALVIQTYGKLAEQVTLTPVRLAVERSYTVEPILPLLRAQGLLWGLDIETHCGPFDAYPREFLDPASEMYAWKPDVVLLSVLTRSVAPHLWSGFSGLSEAEVAARSEECSDFLASLIGAFRLNTDASLLLHTLDQPPVAAFGIADPNIARSQRREIDDINRALACRAADRSGVYLLDINDAMFRCGRDTWDDPERWLTMRIPLSGAAMLRVADQCCRALLALSGRACKVVVTDLDNTLWGGVVGEEGLDGLALGREYPGASYQELQRVLLDLRNSGILLAICSKNNEQDALMVFGMHSGMLLGLSDFSACRINWCDKATNIREIAQELNVGLDTILFIDDNPAECERVQQALPDVDVLCLPVDRPVDFARRLQDVPRLSRLCITGEDRVRAERYQAQRQRHVLRRDEPSLESFYRTLDMEMTVRLDPHDSVGRIAQLTQRTNQFNVTTRRYAEAEVEGRMDDPAWDVVAFSVSDRFGEQGIVGVAMACADGVDYVVDTFLMSCRVIGRTVETAMLSVLFNAASRRRAERVVGEFISTTRNGPAATFYEVHGFERMPESTETASRWARMVMPPVGCPEWIKVDGDDG